MGGTHTDSEGGPLAELYDLLRGHRSELVAVTLYAAAVGLLALASPIAVQALVGTVAFGTLMQPLIVLSSLLLLGLLVAALLKALKLWTTEVLQRRLFAFTVARLAHRLPRAHPVDVLQAEGWVHRFFDLFTVQKSAATLLLGGVDAVLTGLVGMLVLAFYHPVLLAFDVVLVLVLLGVVFGLGRGGIRASNAESADKYAVASFLSEVGARPTAFRTQGGRAYAEQKLNDLAQQYLERRSAHFRIVLRQVAGSLLLQAFASAGVLGLGGMLVMERELTLGQLVAAELIVSLIVAALTDFGKQLESFYDLVTAAHKLDGVLHVPLEPEGEGGEADQLLTHDGPAELQLVDVHVTRGEEPLLAGASVTLPAGSRARVVGDAGKTTLLQLLFGTLRPERGYVQVDGTDLRELSRAALRQRIALVGPAELVSGDVVDNVRLGRADVSLSRVRRVLDDLGLTEELASLPSGVDTPIGPGGARLTNGQAFRLTLARALVEPPGVLALDADLAMLDVHTAARVEHVLGDAAAPWTLLAAGDSPLARRLCPASLHIQDGALRFEEGAQA